MELLARLKSRLKLDPETGCEVFTGCRMSTGYGAMSYKDKMFLVHRKRWELENGPVPDGKYLHHVCRNRACANLSHLRVVSQREHAQLDGFGKHQLGKTHCPAGHPYDEANTYVYRGRRNCRLCNLTEGRRQRAEKRKLEGVPTQECVGVNGVNCGNPAAGDGMGIRSEAVQRAERSETTCAQARAPRTQRG